MGRAEQGVRGDRYTVIPRVMVLVTRGAELLLLKGAPTKRIWPNRYNGVGGHVERGEDLLSAARRELEEETGLRIANLWLAGAVTVDSGQPAGIAFFIFRGIYEGGELRASGEGSLEWVHLDRLGELPLVEDLPVLLPRVLAVEPGQMPVFARYSYDEQDRLVIAFGE